MIPRLKASSWKMKKIAIVITTKVCLRGRSAIDADRYRDRARDDAGERHEREHRPAAAHVQLFGADCQCVGAGAEEDGVTERDVARQPANAFQAVAAIMKISDEERDRRRRRVREDEREAGERRSARR